MHQKKKNKFILNLGQNFHQIAAAFQMLLVSPAKASPHAIFLPDKVQPQTSTWCRVKTKETLATWGRGNWPRKMGEVKNPGISNQAIAQAKAWYCNVLPSNSPAPDFKANRRLQAKMVTVDDRPILWQNVYASIGCKRIKRAAVSRPQGRKDAGLSLANIGLRIH